jgi:hypothetical protein
LTGRDVAPLWGLPAETALDFLRCETEQPVDDILVGTSKRGNIFIQVKHTVRLERDAASGIGSAIHQFVRQFVTSMARAVGTRPWERLFDPDKDRLVLVVGSKTSAAIIDTLPTILARVQNLTPEQPVLDAATTQAERQIWDNVLTHVGRAWKEAVSAEPNDQELRQFLRVIRVHYLDVDPAGQSEREAIDALAALTPPTDAPAPILAWTALIELCGQFAASRSGGDRARLQIGLQERGIHVGPSPKFEADIARLRELAVTVTNALAQLAEIRVGQSTIKIERTAAAALRAASESGSLVVIGHPGAGKSGLLHDLAAALVAAHADVVVLAVDRLASQSLLQLRGELGLHHDLVDVLRNWPGASPGYVIIDALDSARSEPAAAGMAELVGSVTQDGGRWRVVAAVRKFDLAKSALLQPLFAGQPPEQPGADQDFGGVRHINISVLDPPETSQVASQSSILGEVIARAPDPLKELLRLPFNLRLVAEMITGGVPIGDFSPIQTQISLLDKYWLARIVGTDQLGYARENILRDVAQKMVHRRALRVRVADLELSSIESPELEELLGRRVLVHWSPASGVRQRDVIAFAHNLLFDYAVGRSLFFSDEDRFVQFLEFNIDAAIAIRPSAVLSFQHYWYQSANVFWDLTRRIELLNKSPEIIRLIGPTVASELVRNFPEFEPLITAIRRHDQGAAAAFRHLVGSLLAATVGHVKGEAEQAWTSLAEAVARTLEDGTAYALATLLNILLTPLPQAIPRQEQLGRTSRDLLAFVRRRPYESWLSRNAVTAVCRSYCTDPAQSSTLLRLSFKQELLKAHGHEEIPTFAREVGPILDCDPEFVAELYKTAFSHRETSEATTFLGDTVRVLTLTSTRKQDYELSHYILAERFLEFIRRYPLTAFEVAVVVTAEYIRSAHSKDAGEPQEAFEFLGRTANIRRDYSEIWDSGGVSSHATPLQLLDILDSYLTALLPTEATLKLIDQFLAIIAAENVYATIWRRLLQCATTATVTLGVRVWELACAIPILIGLDTSRAAGEYLSATFPLLKPEQRARIEEAIWSVGASDSPLAAAYARNDRDRLLGCLNLDSVVTVQAKARIEEMRAAGSVPPNEPRMSITGGPIPFTTEDYLAERGVPLEIPANRYIRELEKSLEPFNYKHLNSPPTRDDIDTIAPGVYSLYAALQPDATSGIHEEQADHAWAVLAECCERITSSPSDWQSSELGEGARTILLTAANNRLPLYTANAEEQFNRSAAWGGPAARISAAAGLIQLKPPLSSPEVQEAVRRLASDKVPPVRYQIAARMLRLYEHNTEVMWELCRQFGGQEVNRGVLSAVMPVFGRLAARFPDEIVPLTAGVFERLTGGDGLDSPRDQCVSIFAGLALWQGNPTCLRIVGEIVASPSKHEKDAEQLVRDLERNLNPEPGEDPERANRIAKSAFAMLDQMARSVVAEAGAHAPERQDSDRETVEKCAKIGAIIGSRLYFASGAFKGGNAPRRLVDVSARREFFDGAEQIIRTLSVFTIPAVTHNLLEILHEFADIEPRKVLLDSALILDAAKRSDYANDSMAADLVADIVERFIADQRSLLRNDAEARMALIGMLDQFVQMAWPRVQRLVYRLDEIYR